MEGIRERYEELYREWADCMTPWDELTETQKVFWLRLFARLDFPDPTMPASTRFGAVIKPRA